MVCNKCGGQVPEGAKFCGVCGEKVDSGKPKKKLGKKQIIIIAIAIVVVIAVAIVLPKLLSKSKSYGNVYAYMSGEKYELLTDIKSGTTIEIDSTDSYLLWSDVLEFDPNGKYVYYYTNYDSGAGTLCRAEYGKLKKDSGKNDRYIDVIAQNVEFGCSILDNGDVIYETTDDTLCYYNGKEEIQIGSNVYSYYTEGSEYIVYTSENDDYSYDLYCVKLSDAENKIKLASNIYSVISTDDLGNILFIKNDEDYRSLYSIGVEDQETKKVGEDVSVLGYADGKVYFTAKNSTVSLYDFVEDSYADADAGISEPSLSDFECPYYKYSVISGNDVSEDDYEELYTSCTKDLYWYRRGGFFAYNCSMSEALTYSWGDSTDSIYLATQNFIDKFADTADENGYILVTDEVKAALEEINNSYSEGSKNWMWLCCYKYQFGTTTDYDAYYDARDAWKAANNRNSLREQLNDEENAQTIYTLYCLENGTLTPINEKVLDVKALDNSIMYNTTDFITEKLKIEDINRVSDVSALFNLNNDDENYIVVCGGTTCQMSETAAATYAEAVGDYGYDYFYGSGGADLYFSDNEVYMSEGEGTLSVATITNGIVGEFSVISDNAKVLGVEGNVLYYVNEPSYGDIKYGDLCSYNDGNNNCLVEDILIKDVNLYEDGTILVYSDYETYNGYELTMIDADGKSVIIGEHIDHYIRVNNSTLLYLAEGDLYCYDGSKQDRIKGNVDWIWSKNSMEIINTFTLN